MLVAARHQVRSLMHILDYTFRFFLWAIRHDAGLCSKTGRSLILGKIRRSVIVCVPGLGPWLRRKHGLVGECSRCGASCNLLMRCPQWGPATGMCRIYESRPPVCRLFPITPADLRDVELSMGDGHCSHRFESMDKPIRIHRS